MSYTVEAAVEFTQDHKWEHRSQIDHKISKRSKPLNKDEHKYTEITIKTVVLRG